jgi:UDP-2,3-diacylglucosamine pyrophosphatase LpxH
MSEQPGFDEVHIVSDLHMGGRPGFQILRETARLAGFIERLRGQRPGGRVALMLNGDVFDTLAEDVAGYVAVDDAPRTVRRIMDDPAFAPIWNALAGFVRTDGRTLAIVIGNHDIEIAFPWVQRVVLDRLAGDDLAARARVEFSTAGAGYGCTVGRSRVFCIHGNEVDAWNYNRYEELAKVARRMNAGLSLDRGEWQPNAGTRMVKDVMNDIKRRYAWIDLLKPETSAAVGTLLVLDPSQVTREKVRQLLGIVGEKRRGDTQVDARLSGDGFVPPAPAAGQRSLDAAVGRHMRSALAGGAVHGVAEDMLLEAENNFDRPGAASPLEGDDTLGTARLVWDRLTGWLTGVSETEALRCALLDWLEEDKSWSIDDRDQTFRDVTRSIGPAVDFIVTGHTHLERAIDMGHGRYYFNSGTWIRLLQFTPQMLADEASFEPVHAVLRDGRMAAIDEAVFGKQPFVMDQTSAVSIVEKNGAVTGSLLHVEGDGKGEPHVVREFTRR